MSNDLKPIDMSHPTHFIHSLMIQDSSLNERLVNNFRQLLLNVLSIYADDMSGCFFHIDGVMHRSHDVVADIVSGTVVVNNCQFVSPLPVMLGDTAVGVIDHQHVPCFLEKYHGGQNATRVYYSSEVGAYVRFNVCYNKDDKPDPYISVPKVTEMVSFYAASVESPHTSIHAITTMLSFDGEIAENIRHLRRPIH